MDEEYEQEARSPRLVDKKPFLKRGQGLQRIVQGPAKRAPVKLAYGPGIPERDPSAPAPSAAPSKTTTVTSPTRRASSAKPSPRKSPQGPRPATATTTTTSRPATAAARSLVPHLTSKPASTSHPAPHVPSSPPHGPSSYAALLESTELAADTTLVSIHAPNHGGKMSKAASSSSSAAPPPPTTTARAPPVRPTASGAGTQHAGPSSPYRGTRGVGQTSSSPLSSPSRVVSKRDAWPGQGEGEEDAFAAEEYRALERQLLSNRGPSTHETIASSSPSPSRAKKQLSIFDEEEEEEERGQGQGPSKKQPAAGSVRASWESEGGNALRASRDSFSAAGGGGGGGQKGYAQILQDKRRASQGGGGVLSDDQPPPPRRIPTQSLDQWMPGELGEGGGDDGPLPGEEEFEDHSAWGDDESISRASVWTTQVPKPSLRGSLAAGGGGGDRGAAAQQQQQLPPSHAQNKLVRELFGGRGGRGGRGGGGRGGGAASTHPLAASLTSPPSAAFSALEATMLQELESEIRRLQDERNHIERLKTEIERERQRAALGKTEFEKEMESKRREFETHKSDELRKMQRDRRVLEKQAKALLQLPTKKERSEVEALSQQMEAERSEMRAREARHKLTVDRLRRQVTEAQATISELREEIKWHEKRALEQQWVDREGGGGGGMTATTATAAAAPAAGKGVTKAAPPRVAFGASNNRPGAALTPGNSVGGGPAPPPPPQRPQTARPPSRDPTPTRNRTASTTTAATATIPPRPATATATTSSHRAASARAGVSAALSKALGARPSSSSAAAVAAPPASHLYELDDDRLEEDEEMEGLDDDGFGEEVEVTMMMSRMMTGRLGEQEGEDDEGQGEEEERGKEGMYDGARYGGVRTSSSSRPPTAGRGSGTSMPPLGASMASSVDRDAWLHSFSSSSNVPPAAAANTIRTSTEPPPPLPPRSGGTSTSLLNVPRFVHSAAGLDPRSSSRDAPPLGSPTRGSTVIATQRQPDGKMEISYSDGRRRISFPNGTRKEVLPDGRSLIQFTNGDVKKSDASTGCVEYYYREVDTWHTTMSNGLEVFHFGNGQVEAHHKDGSKEILFGDGVCRAILADGSEMEVEGVPSYLGRAPPLKSL